MPLQICKGFHISSSYKTQAPKWLVYLDTHAVFSKGQMSH